MCPKAIGDLCVIRPSMKHLLPRGQMNHLGLHPKRPGDDSSEFKNGIWGVGADVEHLVPRRRVVDAAGYDWRDIINVGKRSCLEPVAEDGHWLAAHDLVHENAYHVAVAVRQVLPLAVDVMRTKDHVVQAEHPVCRLK